ncbi:MAG: cobalt-precorrin-5B (C(1))-methyltransferase [Myxococcales bacterium]
MAVPPRDKKGLRTGFTTGACAAAAAKAATRILLRAAPLESIESTLPNRQRVIFPLAHAEREGDLARCAVVKDGGDDPDCTHGARIVAEVSLRNTAGVEIRGGEGVATVTKPGLGLEVGGPAINPVPRRNIAEMVEEELRGSQYAGAVVTISVPGGEELAKQTTNARLGLLGGISILGTSGIVKPYSTAAYRASVVQAIDVAKERGIDDVVLTTGGKSEAYAMKLFPHLPEEAFVQMGDFVGVAVKHAARRRFPRAHIVGMIGKLSKMANGKMQTHVAGSEVNLELLAGFARELGADFATCERIGAANTARHVLEICTERGIVHLTELICQRAVEHTEKHAGSSLAIAAIMVDFGGALLARHPRVEAVIPGGPS